MSATKTRKTPKTGTLSSAVASSTLALLPVQLKVSPRAAKALRKLPDKQFGQLRRKIEALKTDPYPADRRTMTDYPGILRLDVGEYRIAFTEHKTATTHFITIELVDRRNDARFYDQVKRLLG